MKEAIGRLFVMKLRFGNLPVLLAGVGNSLFIALCTTVLSLAIALSLALLAARYDFRGKALLSALLLVPLILPPFVGAIGLRLARCWDCGCSRLWSRL